ncbi:MAG: LacI family transcriptional regulator [Terrimicrobiaceae bacterium]|nr:LacI family transcriptional regulator [Terrimicrobiaceae bacterium]
MAAPTMGEIAKELGLSRATVSMIVNGRAARRGISPRTISRVREHLRTRGYVPSRQALALRQGVNASPGLMVTGSLYSHLTEAFNRIVSAWEELPQGFEAGFFRPGRLLHGLREMAARRVHRLLWINTGTPPVTEWPQEAIAIGRQLRPVIYNYRFDMDPEPAFLLSHGFSLVGVRRCQAFEKMARLLRAQGCRNVLIPDAGVEAILQQADEQFERAMRSAGLECIVPGWPKPAADSLAMIGFEFAKRAARLLAKSPVDAIAVRDDEVAAGLLAGLRDRGVRVPEDLAVVSMDGHPLSKVFSVPLTTVALPVEDMVRAALDLCESPSDAPAQARVLNCQVRLGRTHLRRPGAHPC